MGRGKVPQGCPLDRSVGFFRHGGSAGEGRVFSLAIHRMRHLAPDHQEFRWHVAPIDRSRNRVRRDRRAWIGLAISFAAVLVVIAGYEFLYRQATHESFLAIYLARQIGAAAVAKGPSYLVQKLSNLVFYGGRLLWFAFPASLAVLAVVWKQSRRKPVPARRRQAFFFSVGVSLLYVVLFSLSDRHADRYIFPAYYLFAACGMISAANQSARLHRFIERWDRHHQVLTPLLWLILFCLNLASGPAGVPHIEV